MKKLLMVAVSAFALSFAGNVYAGDIDADLLSGSKNDHNADSVVGNDNDGNDVNSYNTDSSDHANDNKVDDSANGAGVGNDNDGNSVLDVNIDDIDVTIKIDASKRIAKSSADMTGYVADNKTDNGGANVNLAYGAKQAAGNSIKTGGIGQSGNFDAGINVQQAASGVNTLNQAQVQVSAQASFNGL
ncbi:MAG: hypothetical protein ACKVOI_17925 [Dongiaceae bacterium]